MTRHEKTLHAEAHLKRLQQDQEVGNVADEVTVAYSSIAQPRTLGTPPDDEAEPEDHAEEEPLSPDNVVACSLSPSSSSSSNLTVSHHHRASITELARTSTHNPASSVTMATSHIQAPATTSPPNPQPSTAHASTPKTHSYDHTALDVHAGDQSLHQIMEHTDMTMALDDVPISEIPHQDPLPPSTSMDHDPTQFFFSPMQSFDIDDSAFAFLSLPDQPAAHSTNNQASSNPLDNFGLQQLPMEGSGIYSIVDNSMSHSLPRFGAPHQSTDEQDTPKSYSSSNGLPSLQETRQSYNPAPLDDLAYETIRNDLFGRLTISASNVEIPPAKVCQGFLSSYITNFHGHLPIIHLETFSPRATPSPLILAMCSIGALYRLDRRRAKRLYQVATSSLEIVGSNLSDLRNMPLIADL